LWEQVYGGDEVNELFKPFSNIFLRIYYSGFPPNSGKEKNEPKFMDYTRNNNLLQTQKRII